MGFSQFANGCKCFKINNSSRRGRVAQLGEHLLCRQGVTGSSPVTSTKFSTSFNKLEGEYSAFPSFVTLVVM
jgi:hypothetical protein